MISENPHLGRKARCQCDLPVGTCANINCPHSLSSKDTSSFWIEGWALSKYSEEPYVKTHIGNLIKRIKYDRSIEYTEADRNRDAREISNKIIDLIKLLYDPKNLPFDVCICPPSHSEKPLDLAEFICKSISGGSIKFARNSIVERIELDTIKKLPKYERSLKMIDNFVFNPEPTDYPKKGVLLIDDVFDTGSTLMGLSRAVKAEFPNMPRYVITASYIGQMGRIQAL